MSSNDIQQVFQSAGALVFNSHLVYTSGLHGSAYVNKDALYPDTQIISDLCKEMAERIGGWNCDVVLGPALGGIILSQWVAHHLSKIQGRKIFGVYAEKTFDDSFVVKRGYDKLLKGRKTLIVEDVLTTGGSVKKLVEVSRKQGAEIVGVAALCNRGNVTKTQLGDVPQLSSLLEIKFETYDPVSCPLCAKGVPINQELGKGKKP